MSEYTIKLVDGVEVPLTPQEIAELELEAAQTQRKQIVGKPTFDMGPSMYEVLTSRARSTRSPPPAMMNSPAV